MSEQELFKGTSKEAIIDLRTEAVFYMRGNGLPLGNEGFREYLDVRTPFPTDIKDALTWEVLDKKFSEVLRK
jgi:hypothetical protein